MAQMAEWHTRQLKWYLSTAPAQVCMILNSRETAETEKWDVSENSTNQ